ncbi:MAG: C40 family peptidase [Bacteroidota bacterium]
MKNTIAIVLLTALIISISGCGKIASDSDNPPPMNGSLDTMRVRGDSAFAPGDTTGLYQDTTAQRDTVDFNSMEIPTKGPNSNITELASARTKIDSIMVIAHKQLGTPYEYGSCEAGGFDCSGFIFYVFKSVGMELPRSSAAMAPVGKEVPLEQARKGDLIFFTGTDPLDHSVGHAGIIVNDPGKPVEFIHSSSNETEGGVKITNYAASNYDKRFLKVKRVL